MNKSEAHPATRNFFAQIILFVVGLLIALIPSVLSVSIISSLVFVLTSILISISLVWAGYEAAIKQSKKDNYSSWKIWGLPIVFIIIIGGLTAYYILQFYAPPPSFCIIFLEKNGQVVMEAENYSGQLAGKPNPDSDNPARDATGIVWQENSEYPGTLQAIPNTFNINTQSYSNGPALLFVIKFETSGAYYVYVRGYGVDGNSDSIHVGLGGTPVTDQFDTGLSLWGDTKPVWTSQNDDGNYAIVNVPSPGIYTFHLWMRENGVIVDKIWLDTGMGKVENGNEDVDPPESKCVSHFEF